MRRLFDHSFVIVKTDKYLRFESYIDQYEPRKVIWNTWKKDLLELFTCSNIEIIIKWEEIFNVKCDPIFDINNIEIIVNN